MQQDISTVWTFGHSTRSLEEMVQVLQSFQIEVLADVRRYPGSKKFPHFNSTFLLDELPKFGIDYLPMTDLGGRRKTSPDSTHTAWKSDSFRGYADYTDTEQFGEALQKLKQTAIEKRTAYMCSEAVWWRCHRAIISDCLKAQVWNVQHIMKEDVATPHPFTSVYLQTHS